ncbi:TKL protein kinase [Saprolegnia diclina VS20]|uniref:TKL protein kinase n=1 Tax=Saprolegnia diclina (strain VS20) TaxID=1156394 RepID=T0Q6W2_SAPDV|nr:TKL protein kinase [Saprolegnia diclina VS20]EQC30341.1 TKL protein kinase [Saprolegnia diclina VS20]|eukprot:XP_008616194.1 TKL protein kinase [Saprolegnia diclina VS20]
MVNKTTWTCNDKKTWATSDPVETIESIELLALNVTTNRFPAEGCTAEGAPTLNEKLFEKVKRLNVIEWSMPGFDGSMLPPMPNLNELHINALQVDTNVSLCTLANLTTVNLAQPSNTDVVVHVHDKTQVLAGLKLQNRTWTKKLCPLETAQTPNLTTVGPAPSPVVPEGSSTPLSVDPTKPPPAPASSSSSGTTIGLAVGFSAIALLLAAIIFVRRRRRSSSKDDANAYHEFQDRTLIAGGSHESIVMDPPVSASAPRSKLQDHPVLKAHWRADLMDAKRTVMRGSHDMLWCRDASGAKLALKSLDLTTANSAVQTAFVAGFQRISSLQHNHLGRVLGVSVVNYDAALVLATPYCEKGALSSVLHDVKVELDTAASLVICRHVTLGLQYLHAQGCVYGRVSTSKVLLDEHLSASLNIFALLAPIHARSYAPETSFGAFALAATAPELLMYQSGHSPASDVYALGMLLGEVFMRVRPYAAQQQTLGLVGADLELLRQVKKGRRPPFPFDEKALTAATSAAFVALIKACLHLNPSKRPTIDDVVARLRL